MQWPLSQRVLLYANSTPWRGFFARQIGSGIVVSFRFLGLTKMLLFDQSYAKIADILKHKRYDVPG